MNTYGFNNYINTHNLVGQVFGKWTVVKLAGRNKKYDSIWLCRCQCGAERVIDSYSLRHGRTKSCRKCAAASKVRIFHFVDRMNKVIASVEDLIGHGSPLEDVLARLVEERDKALLNPET